MQVSFFCKFIFFWFAILNYFLCKFTFFCFVSLYCFDLQAYILHCFAILYSFVFPVFILLQIYILRTANPRRWLEAGFHKSHNKCSSTLNLLSTAIHVIVGTKYFCQIMSICHFSPSLSLWYYLVPLWTCWALQFMSLFEPSTSHNIY